jgi:hypothetical protein
MTSPTTLNDWRGAVPIAYWEYLEQDDHAASSAYHIGQAQLADSIIAGLLPASNRKWNRGDVAKAYRLLMTHALLGDVLDEQEITTWSGLKWAAIKAMVEFLKNAETGVVVQLMAIVADQADDYTLTQKLWLSWQKYQAYIRGAVTQEMQI